MGVTGAGYRAAMRARPAVTRSPPSLASRPSWTRQLPEVVASIASGVAVWWATGPWGVGLTPDSVAYVAVAEAVRDHHELGYWLEPSLSSWPPLYPSTLAGLSWLFHLDTLDAARLASAALQGMTVLLVAVLARRMLRSAALCWIAVVFAATAGPLLQFTVRALSEPLFNVLALGATLVLSGIEDRHAVRRLALACVLASAALSTRYAGLVLLPVGITVLLLWPRGTARRPRARRAIGFGVPVFGAAAALAAWNLSRTGTAFGPRIPPDEPFTSHLGIALSVVGQWFLPVKAPAAVAGTVGVVVLVGAVSGVWVRRARSTRPDGDTAPPIGVEPVLTVFVASYAAYMVVASSASGFARLDSRLMLAILVPIVLLLLGEVDRVVARGTGPRAWAPVLLTVVVLLPGASEGLAALHTSHDAGSEYTNEAVRAFVASPVVAGIPRDCALISNDAWMLWLAGREAQFSPVRRRDPRFLTTMTLTDLEALVARTSVCFVWLDIGSTLFLAPTELGPAIDVVPVAGEGVTSVYRLRARLAA